MGNVDGFVFSTVSSHAQEDTPTELKAPDIRVGGSLTTRDQKKANHHDW